MFDLSHDFSVNRIGGQTTITMQEKLLRRVIWVYLRTRLFGFFAFGFGVAFGVVYSSHWLGLKDSIAVRADYHLAKEQCLKAKEETAKVQLVNKDLLVMLRKKDGAFRTTPIKTARPIMEDPPPGIDEGGPSE